MIDLSVLLRFALVGGTTGALYFGTTYVLVEIFAAPVTLASTGGYFAAMCYNYFMHYHFTFESDTPHDQALVRYLLVCAGGAILNVLVIYFGMLLTSVHYMLILLLALVVVVCWSFTMSSLWVFRRQSDIRGQVEPGCAGDGHHDR